MTIHEIKKSTKKTAPYFFSKETMKFFKQTLKDFKVKKMPDGRYRILANSWGGTTLRYFNPVNNELELK